MDTRIHFVILFVALMFVQDEGMECRYTTHTYKFVSSINNARILCTVPSSLQSRLFRLACPLSPVIVIE